MRRRVLVLLVFLLLIAQLPTYASAPNIPLRPLPTIPPFTPPDEAGPDPISATAHRGPHFAPLSNAPMETSPLRQGEALTSYNVELVGQIGGGSTYAVAVQGDYAYIGGGPHLVILNVADPAHPTAAGQTGVVPDIVQGVAVSGTLAYVADGGAGLRIVDVSDPAAPRELGFYDTPEDARGVAVSGTLAYVTAGGAGLLILRYRPSPTVYLPLLLRGGAPPAVTPTPTCSPVPSPTGTRAPIKTTVTLDPSDVSLPVGGDAWVSINIHDVADLYGVDVLLDFDPWIVEVLGGAVEPGTMPYPDFVVKNEADNVNGTIWYVVSQVNPREPASGSGTLARIHIRGLRDGATTLRFTGCILASTDGLEIPSTTRSSLVRVGTGTLVATRTPMVTPTTTPTPTRTPTRTCTAMPAPW